MNENIAITGHRVEITEGDLIFFIVRFEYLNKLHHSISFKGLFVDLHTFQ